MSNFIYHPYYGNQLPQLNPNQMHQQRQNSPIITKVYNVHKTTSTSQKKQYQNQMESHILSTSINNISQQSVQQQSNSFNQKITKCSVNQQQIKRLPQQQPIVTKQTAQQQQIPTQDRQASLEHQQLQNQSREKKQQYRIIQPAQLPQQQLIQSEQDNQQPQSHPYYQQQKLHQVNQLTKVKKQPHPNDNKIDLDQKIEQQKSKQPLQLRQVANPQQKQEYHKTQPQVKENQLQQLTINYQNNYIYNGEGYKPDTREGNGILTDQNGNPVYDGQWKDNQYHGKGKLINVNPEEIEGPFDYQDFNVIENSWSQYEGYFSKGKMNGEGKLQLTNEEFFQGVFVDGLIDGKGKFTTINGQSLTGYWNKGVLTSVDD